MKTQLDQDGCLFIDRDPTAFRYVLNHLQNQLPSLTERSAAELETLTAFYELAELAEIISSLELCPCSGCGVENDMTTTTGRCENCKTRLMVRCPHCQNQRRQQCGSCMREMLPTGSGCGTLNARVADSCRQSLAVPCCATGVGSSLGAHCGACDSKVTSSNYCQGCDANVSRPSIVAVAGTCR